MRGKKIIHWLLGFLPSTLPQGSKEFDDFTKSIFDTYGLADLPSFRNAIATMIMHLGPTTSRVSKHYFAVSIRKAMANQVAYQKIQEIREEEKAAEKAAAEKAKEATTEESPIVQATA